MTEIRPVAAAAATLDACPCCGGAFGAPFYEVGPVPVHSCLMLDSAEAARAFPTGRVRLAACAACGFVANLDFDPRWSAYAPEYEDQQSFSPTFNSFAAGLARDWIDRFGLEGKRAVEIGCSKGDFLALLADLGGMETVGIDPSALPGRVAPPSRGSMRLIQAYFGPEHLDLPAEMIVCRHTLEHIRPVAATLAMMRAMAEATPGAVLCLEVPDATRVWREAAFEDVYYEHCSYFTPGSLARALRRAGFAVVGLRRDYGDQYLVAEAVLDPARDRSFVIEETPEEAAGWTAAFAAAAPQAIAAWRARLDGAVAAGRRVAIWGSGSKCVAFLRTLDRVGAVDAIVDVNPHRAGRHAPGLGLPISPPGALAALKPDLVVVMNRLYRSEITRDLAAMGLAPEVLALGEA